MERLHAAVICGRVSVRFAHRCRTVWNGTQLTSFFVKKTNNIHVPPFPQRLPEWFDNAYFLTDIITIRGSQSHTAKQAVPVAAEAWRSVE